MIDLAGKCNTKLLAAPETIPSRLTVRRRNSASAVATMPGPRSAIPSFVLEKIVEACPSGLLGKLAAVSKQFIAACKNEARRRIGASGSNTPPEDFRLPRVDVRLLETAAEVDWAIGSGCPLGPWKGPMMCEALARGGSIPALARALQRGAPIQQRKTLAAAAAAGHLEVLIWLRNYGKPWWNVWTNYEEVCIQAAANGHLEVLIWLTGIGFPWNESVCSQAARFGHLEVLKWLRNNHCPWDKEACSEAAAGGHLEVLIWLRDNHCPWDVEVCSNAANLGL